MRAFKAGLHRLGYEKPVDKSENGALSYYLIGGTTILLLAIGVVMVLSASTITGLKTASGNPFAEFFKQGGYVLIGLVLAFIATRIHAKIYRKLAWVGLLGGAGLQLLIFTPLGRSFGGNTNWIWIPILNVEIQPSEFLKLALANWLGMILAAYGTRVREWRYLALPVLVSAVCIGLVMAGHDLGTAMVFVMLMTGALWVARVRLWFFVLEFLGLLMALTLYLTITPSRLSRVLHFAGISSADPTGAGYQSIHGLWGLGTGGLFGVGLGASREKWSYLPEAHNDFIFAIIGEELGLLGTLTVLALFGVLAYGMLRVIRRHCDPFVKIATAAVLCWLIGQALVNIAVVADMIPVIGIPLPLVSSGGSAMISSLLALGLVMSFSRTEPGGERDLAVSRRSIRKSLAVVGGSLRRSVGRNRPAAKPGSRAVPAREPAEPASKVRGKVRR